MRMETATADAYSGTCRAVETAFVICMVLVPCVLIRLEEGDPFHHGTVLCCGGLPTICVAGWGSAYDKSPLDKLTKYLDALISCLSVVPLYCVFFGEFADVLMISTFMQSGVCLMYCYQDWLLASSGYKKRPLGILAVPFLAAVGRSVLEASADDRYKFLLPCIIVPVLIQAFVATLVKHLLNQLKQERNNVRSSQECLQSLLAAQQALWRCVFDASCTCSSNGTVLECTRQFDEMLADLDTRETVDTVLPTLCTTQVEKARLSSFFTNVGQSSSDQAFTIQTTFRMAETTAAREVKIWCVAIPEVPSLASVDEGKRLMVAIQSLHSEEPVMEEPSQVELACPIYFDAGTSKFSIFQSSDLFRGDASVKQVLDLFSGETKEKFVHWVHDEIDRQRFKGGGNAEPKRFSISKVKMPALEASFCSVREAWVQVLPPSHYHAAQPAALFLSGLRPINQGALAKYRRFHTRLHHTQGTQSTSASENESPRIAADLCPEDSISDVGRARLRRSANL
eukprot:TRINITY_DN21431_c0_g1_i2.p1 TRINITY_DN21431_c0_g1~~TRINITY_DN21431_c0_g1_i2.p1  ORF type:complete len:511 (+),score=73.61 TRINITY_DN21431_c0_g1_i2:110-1642(+)